MLHKKEYFYPDRTVRQNKELYHLDHREGSAVSLRLDRYSGDPRDACYLRKMAASGAALAGGYSFSGFLKSTNIKSISAIYITDETNYHVILLK